MMKSPSLYEYTYNNIGPYVQGRTTAVLTRVVDENDRLPRLKSAPKAWCNLLRLFALTS